MEQSCSNKSCTMHENLTLFKYFLHNMFLRKRIERIEYKKDLEKTSTPLQTGNTKTTDPASILDSLCLDIFEHQKRRET